jgi:hypothetical protein
MERSVLFADKVMQIGSGRFMMLELNGYGENAKKLKRKG